MDEDKVMPNINEISDFSYVSGCTMDDLIGKCFAAASIFIKNMAIHGESDGYCFVLTTEFNSNSNG